MVTINIFESGVSGSGAHGGGNEPLQHDGKEASQGRTDNPPSPQGETFSFEESKAGRAPSPSEAGNTGSFSASDAPAPVIEASGSNHDNSTPAPSDSGGATFPGTAGLGSPDSNMPKPDDRILPDSGEPLTVKKDVKNK